MKLGEYKITNSDNGIVLSKQRRDKDGILTDEFTNIGYYSKLEHLIHRLIHEQLIFKTEGKNIIDTLNDTVEEIKNMIGEK